MNQVGLGVMIFQLSGGSRNSSTEYEGLTIVKVSMDETHLHLSFDNGKNISIWDNGQSCCENRYMNTDDDIQTLVGGRLLHIIAKEGPNNEDQYEVHEQIFVEVATDKGLITLVNHNEHNGYYGGFGLTITEHTS